MSRTLAPIKHGTNGGAQAHRKRGEHACTACLEAERRYMETYRKGHPSERLLRLQGVKARNAAMQELAKRHRREYQQLLNFYKKQMARLENP